MTKKKRKKYYMNLSLPYFKGSKVLNLVNFLIITGKVKHMKISRSNS